MKIIFLVYDSRSGSTLLSREIAAWFPEVYVTPEIRFDSLFRRSKRWWRGTGPEGVRALLARDRVLQKLELDSADATRLIAGTHGTRDLVEALVTMLSKRDGHGSPAKVIIKSGLHLRVWPQIVAAVPEASFIYMVRDPRAVIASKLATERPYHPGQRMAWAGAFVAALQWRWYCRLARRLGEHAPLLRVAYEDLLARHADVLGSISGFLASPLGAGGADYRVPAAERAIHARVMSAGLDGERAEAWRKELAAGDQAVIELACGSEMQRFGYQRELRIGSIRAIGILLAALIKSTRLVLREFGAHLIAKRSIGG